MDKKKKIIIIIACVIGFFVILTLTQWNKTFHRAYMHTTATHDDYAVGKQVVHQPDGERIVFYKNGHFKYGRVEKGILTEIYYRGKYYYDYKQKVIHVSFKKNGEKWERTIVWSKPESNEVFQYETINGGKEYFILEGF